MGSVVHPLRIPPKRADDTLRWRGVVDPREAHRTEISVQGGQDPIGGQFVTKPSQTTDRARTMQLTEPLQEIVT